MAASAACPLCGQALAAAATVCGNCGAKLPDPAPVPTPVPPLPTEDALLRGLEDLKEQVVAERVVEELESLEKAADEEVAIVDRTLGELVAAKADAEVLEERLEAEEADLSEFVRRVESSVKRQAHAPTPPPKPSAAGTAMVAAGSLLSATGLFLLPGAILVGAFTFLGGIATVALGALVRFGRRQ